VEKNEIQPALASAVEEVLETMCFAGVLASAEGNVPPQADAGSPVVTAALHFQGNSSGGFRMGVPAKLARVVAGGFLGREETEVTDSQAGEVVCELANMICGSVLSRLESSATFQITHPELAPPERGASLENAGASRWFDLGDGILTVSLELQQTV
jgi:CheY-specific phosphatase CheX